MSPTHDSRSAGFTLLEVLIGLVITGFALVALFKAASVGMLAVETSRHVEEAIQRAQSHLAAVGAGGTLAPGDTDGDDGDGFRWRLRVRPLVAQRAEAGAGQSTLFDVEVIISWRQGGHTRTVALTSRRLGESGGGER